MSASAEIPDIITGITDAIGLNRLWQTEQQLDSERRRSEQAKESPDEARRTNRKDKDDSGDVSRISITKQKGEHAYVDHDVEIHGVPRRRTPDPSMHKGEGYEWPGSFSLKDYQAKREDDSEPTGVDNTQPSKEEPEPDERSLSLIGSLPPLNQEGQTSFTFPFRTRSQSVPLDEENPFQRPRPRFSSSQLLERPVSKRQRQLVINTQIGPDTLEVSKRKSAARSRWVSATQALRFPTRRKKPDKPVTKTCGTELIAIMAAGAPAANILASHMVLDERSHHRIPVIVDLLKVPFLMSLTNLD
jgi:hypothetical protein